MPQGSRIIVYSDSMLKWQGSESSLLGTHYICSTRAFSGYNLEKLAQTLDLVKDEAAGYFDIAVISAGTNSLMEENFDKHKFITSLKNFLIAFNEKFCCKHVIVLGFFPRAYCMATGCVPQRCRYLHVESPSILHRRIVQINNALSDLIKHDSRFINGHSFVSMFGEIVKNGTWNNSFGRMLSIDGLHLSRKGNELLDKSLISYINSHFLN